MCKIRIVYIQNERKNEQAHIPQAPTLLDNAAYNEWQCHAFMMDNLTVTENHNGIYD